APVALSRVQWSPAFAPGGGGASQTVTATSGDDDSGVIQHVREEYIGLSVGTIDTGFPVAAKSLLLSCFLAPETQQKSGLGGGTMFFSQHFPVGPCMPALTKVNATHNMSFAQALR